MQPHARCLRTCIRSECAGVRQRSQTTSERGNLPKVTAPKELDGAKVLRYAVVSDDVEPTGTTRHLARGVELGPAAALAIANYEGRHGVYLFYLDEHGEVVTDTFHDSVEKALDQAAFEYRGLRWSDVT